MRTKDVEKELGITKHTLRYYEKEGLIHPVKDENGYRNYSEEDLQVLHLVKFLRNLNISIDDVRGIINGTISFQESLSINKVHLDEKIEELHEIQRTIITYQEKDIPLIPALQNIKEVKSKKTLGFNKTTKTISLGRKLTKSLAKKQWVSTLGISLFFAYLFSAFISSGFNIKGILSIVIYLVCSLLLQQVFIGMNTKASMFWVRDIIDHSQNQSIEFLHDRIYYYKFKGFIDNIRYFYSVLLNKEHYFMKEVLYQDIKSINILMKHRYIKIGTPISSDSYVLDFDFQFKDGSSFYFYWPLTLEDDLRYIAIILDEMVDNIIDKDHILEVLKQGIDLNEYVNQLK